MYGRLLFVNREHHTTNMQLLYDGASAMSHTTYRQGDFLVAPSFRVPAIPVHHLHAKIQKQCSPDRSACYFLFVCCTHITIILARFIK